MRPIYERLSPRQKQYADCLLIGMCNQDIANKLGVTIQVVKNRLRVVFDAVGADSRLQCANLLCYEKMEHLQSGGLEVAQDNPLKAEVDEIFASYWV